MLINSLKSTLSSYLAELVFIVTWMIKCRFRITGLSRSQSRRASFQPQLFPALQGPWPCRWGHHSLSAGLQTVQVANLKQALEADSRLCGQGPLRSWSRGCALEGDAGSGWHVFLTPRMPDYRANSEGMGRAQILGLCLRLLHVLGIKQKEQQPLAGFRYHPVVMGGEGEEAPGPRLPSQRKAP